MIHNKYLNLIKEDLYEINSDHFWREISKINLTEDFIEQFQNKVSWFFVSYCSNLSEKFIERFENNVIWALIWGHQKYSANFVIKFKNKLNGYANFIQALNNDNNSEEIKICIKSLFPNYKPPYISQIDLHLTLIQP